MSRLLMSQRLLNRRLVSGIPRPAGTLLRAWSYAAAAGAGMVSYIGYKVNDFRDRHTPEWLKNSIEKFKQFSWDDIEFNFSLPDIVTGVPALEFFKPDTEAGDESSNSENSRGKKSTSHPAGAPALLTTAGALSNTNEDESNDEEALLELSRDLIEIKTLLKEAKPLPLFDPSGDAESVSIKTVDAVSDWQLPSIVVIGSQSSGKSSVLEAIVGQEFLPKGQNMVTRRPIELTLVHTEPGNATTARIPSLNLETTDFKLLQRTLTDLNLAVPASECVSPTPIELTIFSPHVPDLMLTDLPGYIALSSKDQPDELKEKIAQVCNMYIKAPNLILAVCAADVDLANAEALRAAKAVDPHGQRTVGVLTKLDLVEPSRAIQLLQNQQYPLKLGYVGVIVGNQGSTATNLIDSLRGNKSLVSPHQQRLIEREKSFFASREEFAPMVSPSGGESSGNLGIPALRRKLSITLARSLLSELYQLSEKLRQDTLETGYYLKVHYNDVQVTPEVYAVELVDYVKQRCRTLSRDWSQRRIREEIQAALDAKVLSALQHYYWRSMESSEGRFDVQCVMDPAKWSSVLNVASSSLTKSGVGRLSTLLVKQLLDAELDALVKSEPLSFHSEAQYILLQNAASLLQSRDASTADQVENGIKPLKYQIDISESEWSAGHSRAVALLEAELAKCKESLHAIKQKFGRRHIRQLLVDFSRNAQRAGMDPTFEPKCDESVALVQQLVPLLEHINLLKSRLVALDRKDCTQCRSTASATRRFLSYKPAAPVGGSLSEPSWKSLFDVKSSAADASSSTNFDEVERNTPLSYRCCPEVFLCALSNKLSNQAVLLVYHELLADFFNQLPRRMEEQLYKNPSKIALQEFARQNPFIRTHIDVIQRKQILESVSLKLERLNLKFEGSKNF